MTKCFINIRPPKGDEADLSTMNNMASSQRMEVRHHEFWANLLSETTAQIMVLSAGVLFTLFNFQLHSCWISFPLTALIIYIATLVAAWHEKRLAGKGSSANDFEDKMVLIAELVGPDARDEIRNADSKSGSKQNCGNRLASSFSKFLSRIDVPHVPGKYLPKDNERKLVGIAVVTIMVDTNHEDPPGTVGLVTHFFVKRRYRRCGIGHVLMMGLKSLCENKFRSLEIRLLEDQVESRIFLERNKFFVPLSSRVNPTNVLSKIVGRKRVRLRLNLVPDEESQVLSKNDLNNFE